MVQELVIRTVKIANDNFAFPDIKKFPANREITIGRKSENVLVLNSPAVSGNHGKIFIEQHTILPDCVDYEDYSRYGTILIKNEGLPNDIEFIHGRKTKIKSGNMLIFPYKDGQGYAMIVGFH